MFVSLSVGVRPANMETSTCFNVEGKMTHEDAISGERLQNLDLRSLGLDRQSDSSKVRQLEDEYDVHRISEISIIFFQFE